MTSLQEPIKSMDCFACQGKGYLLLWTRDGKQFITRQSYLKSPLVRSRDSYSQVDCGECNGTGKLDLGEVKY